MIKQVPISVVQAPMAAFDRAWAIAEYLIVDPTGAKPPVSILITACKLHDVFTFAECNRNSEWRKHITPQRIVQVLVHGIGERQECQLEASRIVLSRNPRPMGNLYGFNSFSIARPLMCNNNATYENQTEAAKALNLSQSAISRHLRGELRHVKGYTFVYKDQ